MKKVAIVGSRTFSDYEQMKRKLDDLLYADCIIVSGCANGADKLGEKYAKERKWQVERHEAHWDDLTEIPCKIKKRNNKEYNALAGFNRNDRMLKSLKDNPDGGLVAAFWDGESKGTLHMIENAKKLGLEVYVYNYKTKMCEFICNCTPEVDINVSKIKNKTGRKGGKK